MTPSSTGGPGGPQDYEALLRQADARLSGKAPEPVGPPANSGSPRPGVQPPTSPIRVSSQVAGRADRRSARPAASAVSLARSRERTQGQFISWISVLLALGSAVVLGFAIHHALDGLATSLSTVSDWLTVAVIALVAAVLGLVCAIVALFRARPRMVATVGLLLGLVLPILGLVIGAKSGADALRAHAQDAATGVVPLVLDAVDKLGIDPALIQPVIRWLFG